MSDLEALWRIIKESFKAEASPVTYSTMIDQAKAVSLANNQMTIELPTQFHKDYWNNSLTDKFRLYAYEATQTKIEPRFIVESEEQDEQPEPESIPVKPSFKVNTALNQRYTFDTFVIGKGNQMAHAAALVVSEEPGNMYNPLFFYGGVGLGKTHLMHAIGNKMLMTNPDTRVKYVTSEAFTNDFINAIQTGTQEQFRQEYRNLDLLLVDDIQFFADKEGTQEEFFHTFNALYEENKQIVLTSDRLPNEIPKLQDRLVSRFKWGLSVDITPPDLETRIAILRSKAQADSIDIPNDTLTYIAGQIDSNVRELEGALSRVQAYHRLTGSTITTSLASDALKGLKLSGSTALTIPLIQEKVAAYYHISQSDLKGKKRIKQIVVPRQVAMYLSRELTDNSLPKIGTEFGGKDHTTVLHSIDKIEKSLDSDQHLQEDVQNLKMELKP
ncbi:chromosomal replication initiator protein DnaA [Paucilactobacillus suebicus]|uniref:Chromosomal replication initiator protein DnaA n=1 Tax=Paucilactobacillus suebicus DSM 5007 = KCTC 3549 TaxID=1423807 RepID=A0A0R1WAX8_9LACO|nr:chromosomal replication initiator protein DnaA [Paucilactobacillus suebicus]KRM12649.1 chromosomal replication initiation protein [Paucilactobacillus suebicus DSM 5007 = KCTC 3549]